jgi:gluconokinase
VAAETDVGWKPCAIIVMGVSGCGKSTLAAALAAAWETDFVEGDDLHDGTARAKMAAGEPLCDEDRWLWLDRISAQLLSVIPNRHRPAIATCSALKRSYRDRLRARIGAPVGFVHLVLARVELENRLAARTGHFMPATLLDSQLSALEPVEGEPDALVLRSSDGDPIEAIEAWLRGSPQAR